MIDSFPMSTEKCTSGGRRLCDLRPKKGQKPRCKISKSSAVNEHGMWKSWMGQLESCTHG